MYSVVLMAALTAGSTTPSWGSGCHGGGGGCHGGWFAGWRSCHGGAGCYGGWANRSCYGGCNGCSGSAYAGCHASACWGGCHTSAGCNGCHGAHAPAHMAPPGAPGGAAPEPVPAPKKEEKSASINQARLIVELPADAKLYVDDLLMKTTSERRVFNSPRLELGQTYYYMLRAEVVRDGQTVSDTKRVLLRAGEVVQASFRDIERARTEASVAGQ
jgi:uncharacterized protein (TIGR03000 family)